THPLPARLSRTAWPSRSTRCWWAAAVAWRSLAPPERPMTSSATASSTPTPPCAPPWSYAPDLNLSVAVTLVSHFCDAALPQCRDGPPCRAAGIAGEMFQEETMSYRSIHPRDIVALLGVAGALLATILSPGAAALAAPPAVPITVTVEIDAIEDIGVI